MKTFKDYLIEEKNYDLIELTEEDLQNLADSLEWEDIYDLYDDDELADENDSIDEALTIQTRLRRGQKARRSKTKLALARKLRLRRASNISTLRNRAKIAARRMIMKRYLRNRSKASLSAQEKNRIEQQVSSMGSIVNNLAVKMVPRMRELERKRLIKLRTSKPPKR